MALTVNNDPTQQQIAGVGVVDPGMIGGVGTVNPGVITDVGLAPTSTATLPVVESTGMQATAAPTAPSPGDTAQYSPNVAQPGVSVAGGGSTTAPESTTYVDPAAAQAAADLAKANQLRGSITTLINNIRDVYDNIYGDVALVGQDKARAVTDRFGKETGYLTDQFNTEFPTIGNAYAARGAGSSSYRQRAEEGAIKNYDNLVDNLATGRDEDLSKVGEFVATNQATINADLAKLDNVVDRIAASTDPTELESLKAEYQNLKQDLIASRSGYQSQAAFQGQADALVSTGDRTAALQQSLNNIISGAAPSPLKQRVGMTLISQSGLSPADQELLTNDFLAQVSGTTTPTEETIPVTG